LLCRLHFWRRKYTEGSKCWSPAARRSRRFPTCEWRLSEHGECCPQGHLLPGACRRRERKAEGENLPKCVFNLQLYYFADGPILDQTRDNGCEISGWRRSYASI